MSYRLVQRACRRLGARRGSLPGPARLDLRATTSGGSAAAVGARPSPTRCSARSDRRRSTRCRAARTESPRLHSELRLGRDVRCGRKRVARLMRLEPGCTASYRRRGKRATLPGTSRCRTTWSVDASYADAPNRLWLTDITEHPTREGKVYLAAVLDVYSRRIVGWSIADHLRAELVVDAHRDGEAGGSTSTSPARPSCTQRPREPVHVLGVRARRLRAAGLLGSMGRVGTAYRQRADGVILRDATARAARPPPLADTRRRARLCRSSSGSRPGTTHVVVTASIDDLSPVDYERRLATVTDAA